MPTHLAILSCNDVQYVLYACTSLACCMYMQVAGMRRPAAVNKKPSLPTKPKLAAFGDADSDDDDAA